MSASRSLRTIENDEQSSHRFLQNLRAHLQKKLDDRQKPEEAKYKEERSRAIGCHESEGGIGSSHNCLRTAGENGPILGSAFSFGFWDKKHNRERDTNTDVHTDPCVRFLVIPATFAGPYPNRRGEQPRPKRQFEVQDRWTYDPLPNSRQRMTNNTGYGRSLIPATTVCHRCPMFFT